MKTKGEELFSVLRLDGKVIGKVENLDGVSRWVAGLKRVQSSSVRICQSNKLPAVNNGKNRTFKRVATGTLVIGHPVPGAVVEFMSTRRQRCFVLVPFDLTTPTQ